MQCKCGKETKTVTFKTFSYEYCEDCKIEVTEEAETKGIPMPKFVGEFAGLEILDKPRKTKQYKYSNGYWAWTHDSEGAD